MLKTGVLLQIFYVFSEIVGFLIEKHSVFQLIPLVTFMCSTLIFNNDLDNTILLQQEVVPCDSHFCYDLSNLIYNWQIKW